MIVSKRIKRKEINFRLPFVDHVHLCSSCLFSSNKLQNSLKLHLKDVKESERRIDLFKVSTSLSSLICSLSPPTSEYEMLPGSSWDMLYTRGSTSRGRYLLRNQSKNSYIFHVLNSYFVTTTSGKTTWVKLKLCLHFSTVLNTKHEIFNDSVTQKLVLK